MPECLEYTQMIQVLHVAHLCNQSITYEYTYYMWVSYVCVSMQLHRPQSSE